MQVRLLFPLSHTSGAFVASVSTPIGSAVLTVDLAESNDVPLTAEMPSDTTYGPTMACWSSHASAGPELDAREVIGSAETFVIESLDQKNRLDGGRAVDAIHERPYYVAPVGKAEKGYAPLREAMREKGVAGIARIAVRAKANLAALIPTERALLLVTRRTWPP